MITGGNQGYFLEIALKRICSQEFVAYFEFLVTFKGFDAKPKAFMRFLHTRIIPIFLMINISCIFNGMERKVKSLRFLKFEPV